MRIVKAPGGLTAQLGLGAFVLELPHPARLIQPVVLHHLDQSLDGIHISGGRSQLLELVVSVDLLLEDMHDLQHLFVVVAHLGSIHLHLPLELLELRQEVVLDIRLIRPQITRLLFTGGKVLFVVLYCVIPKEQLLILSLGR